MVNSANFFKRLSPIQKWFFIILVCAITFAALPIMIILLIGLLPTVTIFIVDSKNSRKLMVVGCFNMAGVFVYLFNLLDRNHLSASIFGPSDILNLIIILISAALGLFVYSQFPGMFLSIIRSSRSQKLQNIDNRLQNIAEEWGEKILDIGNVEKKAEEKKLSPAKNKPEGQPSA